MNIGRLVVVAQSKGKGAMKQRTLQKSCHSNSAQASILGAEPIDNDSFAPVSKILFAIMKTRTLSQQHST